MPYAARKTPEGSAPAQLQARPGAQDEPDRKVALMLDREDDLDAASAVTPDEPHDYLEEDRGWPFWKWALAVAAVVVMSVLILTQFSEDDVLAEERRHSEQLSRDLHMAWRQIRTQASSAGEIAALQRQVGDLQDALSRSEQQSAELLTRSTPEEAVRIAPPLPAPVQVSQAAAPAEKSAGVPLARDKADVPIEAASPAEAGQMSKALPPESSAAAPEKPAHIAAREPMAAESVAIAAAEKAAQVAPREPVPAESVAIAAAEKAAQVAPREPVPAESLAAAAVEKVAQSAAREPVRAESVVTAATELVPQIAAREPAPAESAEALRLAGRATILIAQGNIGAARLLLERAVELGGASACFTLAESYNPATLEAWGAVGTLGDIAYARKMYQRALDRGVEKARERLTALSPDLPRQWR